MGCMKFAPEGYAIWTSAIFSQIWFELSIFSDPLNFGTEIKFDFGNSQPLNLNLLFLFFYASCSLIELNWITSHSLNSLIVFFISNWQITQIVWYLDFCIIFVSTCKTVCTTYIGWLSHMTCLRFTSNKEEEKQQKDLQKN